MLRVNSTLTSTFYPNSNFMSLYDKINSSGISSPMSLSKHSKWPEIDEVVNSYVSSGILKNSAIEWELKEAWPIYEEDIYEKKQFIADSVITS
jgi:hypothetical protein